MFADSNIVCNLTPEKNYRTFFKKKDKQNIKNI